MSTILELFQQARLAEAAYAKFIATDGTLITNSAAVVRVLQDEDFSESQAAAFVTQWEVIDHVPDTLGDFSATLFRSRQTGACTLAIRGSTDVQDFVEDAKIIFREGLAKHQLVDLYNFWVRANTPAGQGYDAARLIEKDVPFAGAIQIGLIFYGVEFVSSAQLRDANLRVGTGALAVPPAALYADLRMGLPITQSRKPRLRYRCLADFNHCLIVIHGLRFRGHTYFATSQAPSVVMAH